MDGKDFLDLAERLYTLYDLSYKKVVTFIKDFDSLNKAELLKGIYEFKMKSNN